MDFNQLIRTKEVRFGFLAFCVFNVSNSLHLLGYNRWLALLPILIALPILFVLYRRYEVDGKTFFQSKPFGRWYFWTMLVIVVPMVILAFYI